MNKKSITLIIFLASIFCTSSIFAQPRCSFDQKMEKYYQDNPGYEEEVIQGMKDFNKGLFGENRMFVEIPVHVIIVHPPGQSVGSGDNLSLAQIQSQIDALNEDFIAGNSDYNDCPPVFDQGNPNIIFCLASKDENGNPTDGVTRYPTTQNFDNNEFSIKQATGWDRNIYLNMWVAPTIGALGYAYVPSTSGLPNPVLDGIAIWTGTFGGPGYNSGPYNLGRTATHEIGHYLGLGHVWGGGCGSDDGFADTPNQQSSNFGCPNHPSSSCGNGGDMFMNYMDYVDDDCMVTFSDDQSDYMNTILNTSRASLQNAASFACTGGGAPLEISLVQTQDLSCNGDFNGVIEVIAEGGTPSYNYFIDYGNFSNTSGYFDFLPGGTYTITVFDSNGNQESITVSISEPPAILINISYDQDLLCSGDSSAQVTVIAGGGGGNFSYIMDYGPFVNTPVFPNLAGGDHIVEVFDINGCSNELEFSIFEPEALTLDSFHLGTPTCFGDTDGELTLFVSGGTGTTIIAFDTFPAGVQTSFDTLGAGTFPLILSDVNACIDSMGISIVAPDSMDLSLVDKMDPSCFGLTNGILHFDVEGGNGGEMYSLNNGAGQVDSFFTNLGGGIYSVMAVDSNGCLASYLDTLVEPAQLELSAATISDVGCDGSLGSVVLELENSMGMVSYDLNGTMNNTGVFTNLVADTYTVDAIDANGCTASYSFTINQLQNLQLTVDYTSNASCYNGEDGEIKVEADIQGTVNYQLGSEMNTTGVFGELAAGDYTILADNGSGCQAEIEVSIGEPDELTGEIILTTDPLCNAASDGTATFTAEGGTGVLTFYVGNQNNTTGVFENLDSGAYDVLIEDENGCIVPLYFELIEPTAIASSVTDLVNASCAGSSDGSLRINASGGSGDFEYESADGQTNSDGKFDNLAAGDHVFTITDSNGCMSSITAEIEEPSSISLNNSNATDASCAGAEDGEFSAEASGGAGELTYELNGNTNTNGSFDNLPAGDYQLIITDENMCSITQMISIDEPESIQLIDTETENIDCFGEMTGSAQIEAQGGVGNLVYELDGQMNSSGNFENLSAGEYDYIIIDENECFIQGSIVVEQNDEIVISNVETSDVSCSGEQDGSLDFQIDGGTGPYNYTVNGESGVDINMLPAGDYLIEVTDGLMCTQTTTTTIEEPEPLDLDDVKIIVSTGFNDGGIYVEMTGGTGPYSYSIDGENFQDKGEFDDLRKGNYTLYVMDANGCTFSYDFNVPVYLDTSNEIDSNVALYPNPSNGKINIELLNVTDGSMQIELINLTGENIYKESIQPSEQSSDIYSLDLSYLPKGIYLIKLSGIEWKETKKVIIN